MERVIVVGAGLFGSIISKALQEQSKKDVVIIDAEYANAGSAPAACLMKPGWMAGLGAAGVEGMDMLRRLYAVRELEFKVAGPLRAKVYWVPPYEILSAAHINDRVLTAGDGWVATANNGVLQGTVILCAGVWTPELVPGIAVQPKWGASHYYVGEVDPQIRVWAPYKQAVTFNIRHNSVWFGDGTSVNKWDSKYHSRGLEHAESMFGLGQSDYVKTVTGQRPYVSNKLGVLKRITPKTWVATGGAKNGTVLAGYFASKLVREI